MPFDSEQRPILHLNLLNILGVVGDLYPAGTRVARGYLKKPKATAERFVPDAKNSHPKVVC